MASDDAGPPVARVAALMWNLRIDAATGEVVDALRLNDVDSIVLKGRTLADWYSPDAGKTYDDGDIWVQPADVGRAETVLAQLGFAPVSDERGMPEWWLEHGRTWLRERDRGKIDLHRRLQGAQADPDVVWAVLAAHRETIIIGGVSAWRLSEPARALYAVLHATHHGAADVRGLPHLEAALRAVDDATWARALELAGELDALEAFATGLGLLPAGADLCRRIGVPDARSVRTALLASTPPAVALGFEQLSSAHAIRRPMILLRKIIPPPGFVRYWWPPAGRSRTLLLIGYLYRPLWLLKHAPAGYRAWRAARRAARSSS